MLNRFAPLFVALAACLLAPAARAIVYSFDTPISGDPVVVEVELADAPGGVDVTVSIPPARATCWASSRTWSTSRSCPSWASKMPAAS